MKKNRLYVKFIPVVCFVILLLFTMVNSDTKTDVEQKVATNPAQTVEDATKSNSFQPAGITKDNPVTLENEATQYTATKDREEKAKIEGKQNPVKSELQAKEKQDKKENLPSLGGIGTSKTASNSVPYGWPYGDEIHTVTDIDDFHSTHKRSDWNYYDEMWVYQLKGATSIGIVFDHETYTGPDSGIAIYDANNTLIGVFDGGFLKDRTVHIPGDTAKVRLYMNTYSDQDCYGFGVRRVDIERDYHERYTFDKSQVPTTVLAGKTLEFTLSINEKCSNDTIERPALNPELIKCRWYRTWSSDVVPFDIKYNGTKVTITAPADIEKTTTIDGSFYFYYAGNSEAFFRSDTVRFTVQAYIQDNNGGSKSIYTNQVLPIPLSDVLIANIPVKPVITNVTSSDPTVVSPLMDGIPDGGTCNLIGKKPGTAKVSVDYSVMDGDQEIKLRADYNITCNHSQSCSTSANGGKSTFEVVRYEKRDMDIELNRYYYDDKNKFVSRRTKDLSDYTIEVVPDKDNNVYTATVIGNKIRVKGVSSGYRALNYLIKKDGVELCSGSININVSTYRYEVLYSGPRDVYPEQLIPAPVFAKYYSVPENQTASIQILDSVVVTSSDTSAVQRKDDGTYQVSSSTGIDGTYFKAKYSGYEYSTDYISFDIKRVNIDCSGTPYENDKIDLTFIPEAVIKDKSTITWTVSNISDQKYENAHASIEGKADGTASLSCLSCGEVIVKACYYINGTYQFYKTLNVKIIPGYSGIAKESSSKSVRVNERTAIKLNDLCINNAYSDTTINEVVSSDSSIAEYMSITQVPGGTHKQWDVNIKGNKIGKTDFTIKYSYNENGVLKDGEQKVTVEVVDDTYECFLQYESYKVAPGQSVPLSVDVYRNGFDLYGKPIRTLVPENELAVTYKVNPNNVATLDNGVMTVSATVYDGYRFYVTPEVQKGGKIISDDTDETQFIVYASDYRIQNYSDVVYVAEGDDKYIYPTIYLYDKANPNGLKVNHTDINWYCRDNLVSFGSSDPVEYITNDCVYVSGRRITGKKVGTRDVTFCLSYMDTNNTEKKITGKFTIKVIPKVIPTLQVNGNGLVNSADGFFKVTPDTTNLYTIACSREEENPCIDLLDANKNVIESYTINDSMYKGYLAVDVALEAEKTYYIHAYYGSDYYGINYSIFFNESITRTDICDCDIKLSEDKFVYNGEVHKPDITVMDGDDILVEGIDYVLEQSRMVNAGTHYLYVSGRGKYNGIAQIPVVISQISLPEDIVQPYTTWVYENGMVQKPQIELSNDLYGLKAGTDYEIVYRTDFRSPGTHTMTITGIGNYCDSLTKEFVIKEVISLSKCTVTLSADSAKYNTKNQKPQILVKYGETELVQNTDYTVQCTGDFTNAGAHTFTVTGKTAYKDSVIKTFTIEPRDFNKTEIELSFDSKEFDGAIHKPSVYVKYEGQSLYTSEFTVKYSDSFTNAGIYTVTVTGTKNYTGISIEKKVEITPKSIASYTATLSKDSVLYNTKEQKPTVTVKDSSGKELESKNYKVEYSGACKDAGDYTITITGQGNYSGSIEKKFTITPNTILKNLYTLTLSPINNYYNGEEQKPTVKVKKVSPELELIEGTDYDVEYMGDFTNAGTHTVTIKGKGNYSGNLEANYSILPTSITGYTLTLSTKSMGYTGEVQKPTASVSNDKITLQETTDYEVSYTEDSTSVGSHTVTITGKGNYAGVLTDTYSITAKNISSCSAELSPTIGQFAGVEQKPVITVMDGNTQLQSGIDYQVQYTGDFKEIGEYTVTITGINNYNSSIEKTYKIEEKDIANCSVILDKDSNEYTGEVQKPSVTVTNGSIALQSGTDYDIEYTGDFTKIGENTVTITGKGNYTGSVDKKYTVDPKNINAYVLTLSKDGTGYTGDEQKPEVTVGNDSVTLVSGTDYEIEYTGDFTSAGTHTVTVKGKGNYGGSLAKDYTIAPKNIVEASYSLNLSSYSKEYTGNEQKPTVTVGNDSITLQGTSDYEIAYTGDFTNAGTYTITVTGKGNYSGSLQKDFTISTLDLTKTKYAMTLSKDSSEYNGEEQKPTITVGDGNITLLDETDYETEYNGDFTNVSNYTVTVKGKGNYSGTLSKTFTITPKKISSCTVEMSGSSCQYSGVVQKPTITVKNGNIELVLNTDYEIKYTGDFKSVDDHTITINGLGNYGDSVKKTFTIEKKDIAACNITLSKESFTYNGGEQKPTFTVKNGDIDLLLGTDYEITYPKDVTNAGDHTVTITGKGNYQGSKDKTYKITPKQIVEADYELTFNSDSAEYSGNEHKPTITVGNSSITLVANKDYDINYGELKKAGKHTITITGKNNYSGSLTKDFIIKPKDIKKADYKLKLSKDSTEYTGAKQEPDVTVEKDSAKLAKDEYDIEYSEDCTNVGTHTVTIKGKGNYSGSLVTSFEITPLNLDKTTYDITLSKDSAGYTGTEQKPDVTVGDNATTLQLGTDYELIYGDGYVNAGQYTITVKGIGNYSGEKKEDYKIEPKSIKSCNITLAADTLKYNGSEQNPAVTVKDGDVELASQDYAVQYEKNSKNTGTYTITITGKGNYTGESSTEYSIIKASKTIKFAKTTIQKRYRDQTFINPLTSDSEKNVSYTSSNIKVARVDKYGRVSIVGVGRAVITAEYESDPNYYAKASYTLTVGKTYNSITAGNVVKTASSKAQTFTLKKSTRGVAALSYSSNSKSVKVVSGKVTIAKDFVGKAIITIRAASNGYYNSASKTITITVNPASTRITSLKKQSKNRFLLKWRKNSKVSGYEVQYSTSKRFSKVTKKTITKASTTSYQASKLKSKTTYYVRIRTYKKVGKTKYYSAWSSVSRVKN